MGTTTSAVFNGYERVSEKTTAGLFGWTDITNLKSVDRGTSTGANDLNRDLVYSSDPKTFEVVVPDGKYMVKITFGDANANHDLMEVKAEGETVLTNINTTAGTFVNQTFETEVSDEKLSLEFSDKGGSNSDWAITRIIIEESVDTSIRDVIFGNTPEKATLADIYPNPANSVLNIDFKTTESGLKKVSIMNISGTILKVCNSYSNHEEINISDLKDGIYILNIIKDNYQDNIKFIKK